MGWVKLDVASAPLAAGWTTIRDAGSGASIAIPPTWRQFDTLDEAQRDIFAKVATQSRGGGTIGFQSQGAIPDLFAVDESVASLRQPVFTTLILLHVQAGGGSIDKVESGLRESTMPDIQRIELPIGPALRSIRSDPGSKVVMYMMTHDSDSYMVRVTVPNASFDSEMPLIDQMLRTFRLTAPNPSVARRNRLSAPPQNGMVGAGVLPGQSVNPAGSASTPISAPPQTQDQGPSEPAPDPGVSGQGSDDPDQAPPATSDVQSSAGGARPGDDSRNPNGGGNP